MGQQLSTIIFDTAAFNENRGFAIKSTKQENNHQLKISHIQEKLFSDTNSTNLEKVNGEINYMLHSQVFPFIETRYETALSEITQIFAKHQKLSDSLSVKLNQNESVQQSAAISNENPSKSRESLYFVISSFASMILILVKSVENADPLKIHEILSLINQLFEQISIDYLSASNDFVDLCRSMQTLIEYIQDLLLSPDSTLSRQAITILINFSFIKASVKDILSLTSILILDKKNIYDIPSILIRSNNLTENQRKAIKENTALNYLTSLDECSSHQSNQRTYTGQRVCAIILAHLDIHSQIYVKEQFDHNSLNSSLSFDFDSDTFRQLFHVIKQLVAQETIDKSYDNVNYSLAFAIRLFRTHFQFRHSIKINDLKNLLSKNKQMEAKLLEDQPHLRMNNNINITILDDELTEWLNLFSKLSISNSGLLLINQEASKTLMLLIYEKFLSFSDILSLFHKYIVENQHPMLIKEVFNEMSKDIFLLNCIECIKSGKDDRKSALDTFCLLLDMYVDTSKKLNEKYENKIAEIIFSFQHFCIYQWINTQNQDITAFICQYLSYILRKLITANINESELIQEILIGLYAIADKEKILGFNNISLVFANVIPLLSEYLLKTTSIDLSYFISSLLGKMCHVMIKSLPLDPLEKTYSHQIESLLFMGGYEKYQIEPDSYLSDLINSNSSAGNVYELINKTGSHENDINLLISIYDNKNQGANLISKIQFYLKDERNIPLKSIEQQVKDASAAIFAVYIKYYHRLNLVKSALSGLNEDKIDDGLLSLYKYANHVQSVFCMLKAQNGDCDAFYTEVKRRCLFLLLSVKENDLIPTFEDSFIENSENESNILKRQSSHLAKAKRAVRLLRNTMNACIRFKKLMLAKKMLLEQKEFYENRLDQSIKKFLYGDFNSQSISYDLIKLEQCFNRQYQRAILRLVAYRFINDFIKNVLTVKSEFFTILGIFLTNLRFENSNWLYVNDISIVNNQIKEEIRNLYYINIKILLHYAVTYSLDESNIVVKNLFYLMNFAYGLRDMQHFHNNKIIEIIFSQFINKIPCSTCAIDWFCLHALKTCAIIEKHLNYQMPAIIFQESKLIFRTYIIRYLKSLATGENDFYSNLLLVLLFNCVQTYEKIRSVCANEEYIKILIDIYYHNKNSEIIILSLKVLRELIYYSPETCSNVLKSFIEQFLNNCLISIGEGFDSQRISIDIGDTLVSLYRKVIFHRSIWQKISVKLLVDSIQRNFDLKSFENNDKEQLYKLIASLCILGGHVYKHSNVDNEDLQTNEIISNDLLSNLSIDLILDSLQNWMQLDTTSSKSLLLFQIKRQAIGVWCNLLKNSTTIEIFMRKSYASHVSKLVLSHCLEKPIGLRFLNREHLEQYFLSLDRYRRDQEKNQNNSSPLMNKEDRKIRNYFSKSYWKCNEWKQYLCEKELELFSKGRIGSDDGISIVPIPVHISSESVFELCGENHRFKGRIVPNSENTNVRFPSYIVNNIRVNRGKWYFCVRLPVGGLVQIGWATDGFNPYGSNGIGDDLYSWCFDGSRKTLFHKRQYDCPFQKNAWDKNDVCGCGIEIDEDTVKIKYWINGEFCGTAFSHNENISSTRTKCNLLPNGPTTSFFPGVSLQSYEDTSCELIFSPEDMGECPLPPGYKPLLLPELIHIENKIVAYPTSAYLIGDNFKDNVYKTRTTQSNKTLRDFVNENHLEVEFYVNKAHLILPKNSSGFPLSFNRNVLSFTISFDFRRIYEANEKDFLTLLTLNTDDNVIIEQSNYKFNDRQQVVITFHMELQQIKVHMNDELHIFKIKRKNVSMSKVDIYLLPKMSAGIQNLAVWDYILSDEHIQRLFRFGINYVWIDFKKLKKHETQENTLSFTRKNQFTNDFIIPFDEPFNQEIWNKKKERADTIRESRYFQNSSIQLDENQTYLVLDKTNEEWPEYTIILDILIPEWQNNQNELSLISLNATSRIFLTNQRRVCLVNSENEHLGQSSLELNLYYRLTVCVKIDYVEIYLNGSLEVDTPTSKNTYRATLDRFELFRENSSTEIKINEQSIRIRCQSITFLNRYISKNDLDKTLLLPNTPLDALVAPSSSLICPSLVAIGYKKTWILEAIRQLKVTNMYLIDKFIRENHEEMCKMDLNKLNHRVVNVLMKLNPLFDKQKLEHFLTSNNLNSSEQIEYILKNSNDLQVTNSDSNANHNLNQTRIHSDKYQWYSQAIQHLDINCDLNEWLLQTSSTTSKIDNVKFNSLHNRVSRESSDSEDSDDETLPNSSMAPFLRMHTGLSASSNHQCTEVGAPILLDLNQNEQDQTDETTTEYLHENLSEADYLRESISCERALMTVYVLSAIENMIRIQSNNSKDLFPMQKFGDYRFLVQLLRIADYYNLNTTDSTQQVYLLVKDILQSEIEKILNGKENENKTTYLLNELQTYVSVQLIQLSTNPQMMLDQSCSVFLLRIFDLFIELIKNEVEVDRLTEIFFPQHLINLLFDMFLSAKLPQFRIRILQLYSTIIRLGEKFSLNSEIQRFLLNLLVELTSNQISTGEFGIFVTDITMLILDKQKHREIVLPKNIENLLLHIDIIHAFTDEKKEKQIPIEFLKQIENRWNHKIKLTQEIFNESRKYFSDTIDKPLVSFLNNTQSLETAVNEFEQSLLDKTIPTNYINIPVRLLYEFNLSIAQLLTMLDLHTFPEQSFLISHIRKAKRFLLYESKFELLEESLEKTSIKHVGDILIVKLDPLKAIQNYEDSKNTIFYQAFEQLYLFAPCHFRKTDNRVWKAIYIGMHSNDQGGAYRDSITQICSDICSTRLPLFVHCPNALNNIGINRDAWVPNFLPLNKPISDELKKQYRFIGQLMGLAIRKKHYLDFNFPNMLWKQLLNEPITIDDIQSIDTNSFTIINLVETLIQQTPSIDMGSDAYHLFTSIAGELRFVIISPTGETYELIHNGRNIPVTPNNFKYYSSCYQQYRLNEFKKQIDLIRQGLCSVVPYFCLSLLSAEELEQAICGKREIDVELLKRNTSYRGQFNKDSPHIQRFWTVFGEMFNGEQKKQFLRFVWGRNTLPSREEDFRMKFHIDPYPLADGTFDQILPRSHTCNFSIQLPEYSTVEIMYERLNYAIQYCSSIDADGTMNLESNESG